MEITQLDVLMHEALCSSGRRASILGAMNPGSRTILGIEA